MGLLDKFKNNHSLELSNPAIQKMVEWIEHPMEFNKKPESAQIIDERDLYWPTQQIERCYLIRYTVDDKEYVGFTGPITWSFFEIDFNKSSIEKLYEAYCGWYIAFFSSNSETYDSTQEGTNFPDVFDRLNAKGYTEISKLQNVFLGGDNYYELSATKNGTKYKVVGVEDNLQEFPFDHILPFYEFIGVMWNPLDIEA